MKKQEIVRANAALMIAIMFIDLDRYSDTGHPRARPVRLKVDKILQNFNNARNGRLNIRANELAVTVLKRVQEQIQGKVDVNIVAMVLLSELEDLINLPKLYKLPSALITAIINELADINDNETMNRSAESAEAIIKELGYASTN